MLWCREADGSAGTTGRQPTCLLEGTSARVDGAGCVGRLGRNAAFRCDGTSTEGAGTARLPAATLWVARSGCEKVARVNASGKVVARLEVGCQVRAVAVGAGAVWFITDASSVIRGDGESVWALHQETGQLERLEPGSSKPAQVIKTKMSSALYPELGADLVWFYANNKKIVRVPTATEKIASRIPLSLVRAFAVSD